MFRFTREKILPVFLQRQITVADLARQAKVNHQTAERAVQGYPVSPRVSGFSSSYDENRQCP